MHLWPSMRIRDSFKHDYLKRLEWNLHRMKSNEKSSATRHQKLLCSEEEGVVNGEVTETCQNSKDRRGFFVLCREILLVLSCCYCCFCCGACSEQEEN